MEAIVKKSNIENAGRGVFALKNFQKGESICYFDGKPPTQNSNPEFIQLLPDGRLLEGNSDSKHENWPGIGQFVNDVVKFVLQDSFRNNDGLFTLSSKAVDDAIESYTTHSKKFANVVFLDGTLEMVACRDIQSGEELYCHYGHKFWLGRMINCSQSIMDRLFFILKSGMFDVNHLDKQAAELILDEIGIDRKNSSLMTELGIMELPRELQLHHLISLIQ